MGRPTYRVVDTGLGPWHHRTLILKLDSAPEDIAFALALVGPEGRVVREATLLSEAQARRSFEDYDVAAQYANGYHAVINRCRRVVEQPKTPLLSAEALHVIATHCEVGTWEWLLAIRLARQAGQARN